MPYDMVSASDFRSKRNRTAKFRVLNNVSAISEPSRTRSSTNLRQRPPQMHSTYERKSYSQSQNFPNQPSSDRRTFPQHFADQLRFMKPRQTLNKDSNIGHPMQYESLRESRWSVEPRTASVFPSQSNTMMENSIGRAPTKIRTSPALSSPSAQNRQPVTPAIKRHTCDWNVHSKTFQNQFIEKLSPVQRKISLYSTNIKTLTSDSALWNDTADQNDNRPQHQHQPCHQFCHLHRHLHKCCTPQITRYRNLKENPPKDNDADAVEPPTNIPREVSKKNNKVESASNRNENSKSVERRRRRLKDEDIIRVLELMVNKLVKRGANVDKDLLNELRTSITGSPDEHSVEKRDSSTSSSASSSSTDSTSTSSTTHSSESSDRMVKVESPIDDKKKVFRKQKQQHQHNQQQQQHQQQQQPQHPKMTKTSAQVPSSPPLQSKDTELPERSENERCQRRRTKVDRSSAGSKNSLKHDVCSTRSSGELATWNTKTIKRLKMAVDDLFENILETIRTDHSSVASDLSCDQKDFEVHNSDNNKNNNNNDWVDKNNNCTTASLDVGDCNRVQGEIERKTNLKESTRCSRSFGKNSVDNHQLETTETAGQPCQPTKSELNQASPDPVGYVVKSPVNSACDKGERTPHKTRRRDRHGSSTVDVKESLDSHGKPVSLERGCSLDKANQTSSLSLSSSLSNKKHIESPKNFQRILHCRDETVPKEHVFH